MSEQQDLANRIYALACAISVCPNTERFIDVIYDGSANQLRITEISRKGSKRLVKTVDLHEPGESEIAARRINRQLLEVVMHLESLHSKLRQRSLFK